MAAKTKGCGQVRGYCCYCCVWYSASRKSSEYLKCCKCLKRHARKPGKKKPIKKKGTKK